MQAIPQHLHFRVPIREQQTNRVSPPSLFTILSFISFRFYYFRFQTAPYDKKVFQPADMYHIQVRMGKYASWEAIYTALKHVLNTENKDGEYRCGFVLMWMKLTRFSMQEVDDWAVLGAGSESFRENERNVVDDQRRWKSRWPAKRSKVCKQYQLYSLYELFMISFSDCNSAVQSEYKPVLCSIFRGLLVNVE